MHNIHYMQYSLQYLLLSSKCICTTKRHGFFGNTSLGNFPSCYPWLQYKDTASYACCLLHVSRV